MSFSSESPNNSEVSDLSQGQFYVSGQHSAPLQVKLLSLLSPIRVGPSGREIKSGCSDDFGGWPKLVRTMDHLSILSNWRCPFIPEAGAESGE